ncbi:MAG: hypothetical protein C4293_00815 [Nitrospiraceae bacterium]
MSAKWSISLTRDSTRRWTVDLTDEQWALLQPLIPAPRRRPDGRGRPWQDTRAVLNGILWVLKTGARWQDLPTRYPPYQTCHRRFQHWVRSGVLEQVQALAEDVRERGGLDLSEGLIDGTFVMAQKGGTGWEPPSGATGRKSWQWQTALVCRSPSTWPLRRHMTSRSWKPRWLPASFIRFPDACRRQGV